MQEDDPRSQDFGGLHEGEGDQLWRIVETDNTQEAIVAWCLYALTFGDLDTYASEVDDAWTYCYNFPAWEESPADNFYAMHNAGWGLMAELYYHHAYDDEEHHQYAVNCAEHLLNNVPEVTPDMEDNLIPLVAGWAAGTLYLAAEHLGEDVYRDGALRIARQVKDWINHSPDRLHNNEIWALCGGTAMWGVLNSLGEEDPETTSEWAADVLEQMDVFAGQGQWNNSWNIWYAHAWIAAYHLLGDEASLAHAVAIVDSLTLQDGDGDGGIPATIGDDSDRDQSWVTAYTCWMGYSNLFEVLPEVSAAAMGVLEPAVNRPWPRGLQRSFVFALENRGSAPVVEVGFRLEGPIQADTTYFLEGWQPVPSRLTTTWTPDRSGQYPFTAWVSAEGDPDRNDDTLRFAVTIAPSGNYLIRTITESDGTPLECIILLTGDYDTTLTVTNPENGTASGILMEGGYTITAIPGYPYPIQSGVRFEVLADQENRINIRFPHPSVLVWDNDIDTTRRVYFTSSLDALGYRYRVWSDARLAPPDDGQGFSAVIYYTGNRTEATLPEPARTLIESFLAEGKHVLVTGQHLSDELREDPFLADVLHARHLADDMRDRTLRGAAGDPVTDGINLLILGNRGAANQTAPSAIAAVGSMECLFYSEAADTAGAIRWEDPTSGGKLLFCAFGLEAVSGMGRTSTREQFLDRVFRWFDVPLRTAPSSHEQVCITSARAFPIPANGAVSFVLPSAVRNGTELIIRDLQGRFIKRQATTGSTGVWDGLDWAGVAVPTGTYLVTWWNPLQPERPGRLKVILVR